MQQQPLCQNHLEPRGYFLCFDNRPFYRGCKQCAQQKIELVPVEAYHQIIQEEEYKQLLVIRQELLKLHKFKILMRKISNHLETDFAALEYKIDFYNKGFGLKMDQIDKQIEQHPEDEQNFTNSLNKISVELTQASFDLKHELMDSREMHNQYFVQCFTAVDEIQNIPISNLLAQYQNFINNEHLQDFQ